MVGENGYRGEAVGSVTCRNPFGLLFSPSFLNSVTVAINFRITGCFLCFLDTLCLSATIYFIPKVPLLGPSLVETRFECTIPKQFEVSPILCGGCCIAEPENIVKVSEFDESFEVD